MPRKDKAEIWLIEDAAECYDVKTGKAIPIYKFVSKGWEPTPETVRRKDADKATLEDLVGLCDQDAESVNAHDYCGAHRLLGAVLFKQLGRTRATEVMRDIANRRGLHGMAGVCGLPDSYASLGVGQNGSDWSGTFK